MLSSQTQVLFSVLSQETSQSLVLSARLACLERVVHLEVLGFTTGATGPEPRNTRKKHVEREREATGNWRTCRSLICLMDLKPAILSVFKCFVWIFLLIGDVLRKRPTTMMAITPVTRLGRAQWGRTNGKSPIVRQSDLYLGHHCYPSLPKIGLLLDSYAKSM